VARPEIREWLLQSIFAALHSLAGARSRRVKIVLNENLNSQLFIHSFKYRLVISGGTPPAATTPQLSPPNIAPNAQHFDFCRHHHRRRCCFCWLGDRRVPFYGRFLP
jgi:hypothetical protein